MSAREYPSPSLADGQFRLLSLLPGTLTEGVSCTLCIDNIPGSNVEQAHSSARRPEYEALSYTWGEMADQVIRLNGHDSFPVTDNLFYALKRLRYTHEVRVFWIDAVCINQGNVKERNEQVQHMRRIYREATRVIVWLGEPYYSSTSLLNEATEFTTDTVGEYANSRAYCKPWWHSDESLWSLKALLEKQRPLWWDRLWIIQEFAIAHNDPFVCFGNWEVSWRDLTDILVQLLEKQSLGLIAWDANPDEDSTDYTANAFAGLGKLDNIRSQHQNGLTSLCTLAVHSSSANASLGKDKVYGLLGLASERESQTVVIDYAQSDDVVFATATYACIFTTQSLNCLLLSALLKKDRLSLPSWAIDFDSGISLVPAEREALIAFLARDIDPASSWQHRHTCIHSNKHTIAETSLSSDANLLTVHGSPFDVVVETLDVPETADLHEFSKGVVTMLLTITDNPYQKLSRCQNSTHEARHPQPCMCSLGEPEHSRVEILPEALQQLNADRHASEIDWARNLDVVFKHWIRCVWSNDTAVELREPVTPTSLRSLLPDPSQLFLTEKGFLGAAPHGVQLHDRIVLLNGSDWPAILRQQNDGTYLLHGLAFVNGIMDQELGAPCFEEVVDEVFVLH